MANETDALLNKILNVNNKATDKANAIMNVDDDESLQNIRLAKQLIEQQKALKM